MDLNLSVFQEPRGVMRILHFVFSICAFATTTGFAGKVIFNQCSATYTFEYDYPFNLDLDHTFEYTATNNATCKPTAKITADFSSDAKFFVATGVLAMLYSIGIAGFYVKFDQMYKTNQMVPIIDFIISVILSVLWLSGSAAWANGLSGLKHVTSHSGIEWIDYQLPCHCIEPVGSSFFTLNVSVIFGFLNFFLWAANLWFLYKETTWFVNAQPATQEGV